MNQLEVVVEQSGLEPTKAQVILEQFTGYFAMAAEWETKAKAIVVTDISQRADMEMARVGRMYLKERRLEVEKTRKALKETALREGKAIDGIANVLKALIEPIESYLEKQERFAEYEAAARFQAQKAIEDAAREADRLAQEEEDRQALAKARQEAEELRARANVAEEARRAAEAAAGAQIKAEREAAAAKLAESEKARAAAEFTARMANIKILQEQKKLIEVERVKCAQAIAEAQIVAKAAGQEVTCPHCKKSFTLGV